MPDGRDSRSDAEPTLRLCLWLAVVGCCAVIALAVLSRFGGADIWDDAYMSARYADNVLSAGKIAWNPGGEPTYGLTSPLTLLVHVPIRFLARSNPALSVVLQSLLCGTVFVVLLAVLVWRHVESGPLGRRFVLAFVFFALAISIPHMQHHFSSGMDTMFALAYLTAYILLAKGQERTPSVGRALGVGLWGGLAYFARPDLMLYSAAVPIAMLLLGPGATRRRHALLIGGVSLLTLGAQMGLARLYFGSALPLPFYAKTLNIYCGYLRQFYGPVPLREFASFVAVYGFLIVVAGAGLFERLRTLRQAPPAVDCGLAAATALFIAYYLGFAVQIMGFASRFYYPTVPALIFLAAQGAAALVRAAAPSVGAGVRQVPRALFWFASLLVLYALMPEGRAALQKLQEARKQGKFGRFSVQANYTDFYRGYWFGLDRFSALPDDLVLATTEVGLPAVMSPRRPIICLSGLNERAFAQKEFAADRLFREYRPDLVYMPHCSFKTIADAIGANAYFRGHYELFSAEQLSAASSLNVEMGVALCKDSPHYAAMRKIILEAAPNLAVDDRR